MLNPFKKEIIYIRLFENKVELRHLEKDQNITRTSHDKFSNERLLVATVSVAIKFIKEILFEIKGDQLIKPRLVVLIQPMEKVEGGVSEVEKMILRDLIEQIGGNYAFIQDTKGKLSDNDIRKITRI
ncbi:MAG: hypothetical protein COA32_08955 [Fluviicola sp.]|nr:MAG: hypothetical protein COA32_08955 [Fluviicola sp.]